MTLREVDNRDLAAVNESLEARVECLAARVRQLEEENEWLNRQLLDREYVIEEMRKERV